MPVSDESTTRRFTPQVVVAIAVILFGLIKTADNLGWVAGGSLLMFWPVALVALGYTIYARGADRPAKVLGGLLMVMGGWMTIGRVLGVSVSIFSLWPLALVAIGVTMILRARGASHVTTDQRVSDVAFWSGVKRRVSSPTFRRADVTAIMGGIEMDFRPATAARGDAIVDLFVVMGGVEITVPPDWAVSNQILAIMGGVEDRSTGTEASTTRLILRGFVLMGGVEVKT
jgi:predicted membrane protein